jgi:hypothetical protein
MPARLEAGGAFDSLHSALASAIRPVARSLDELLGGGGPAEPSGPDKGSIEPEGASIRTPDAVPALWMAGGRPATGSRASRRSDVVGDALVGLARHRRSMGVAACLLLLCAAAVTAMPSISLAGDAAPTDIYIYETPAADAAMDSTVDVTSDIGLVGNVSIDNVMQPVEAPPGAQGFRVYAVRGSATSRSTGPTRAACPIRRRCASARS